MNITNRIFTGDSLEVLRTFPNESVQTCITSPPYYSLRDYRIEGQIGLEETPEQYIERLVEVFREVKRVLRQDGTCFLNLGDSYAGSGKGYGGKDHGKLGKFANDFLPTPNVGTNFLDCFQGMIKGQPLFFGNATTIRITSQSSKIALNDNGFPYGVFLSLLGIERVTIKQRNNNFCQVFNILNNPSYCWIGCPVVSYVMTNSTDIEIVFDAVDSLSVIISDLNTNIHPIFGIRRVASAGTSKQGDSSLPIEETHEPMPKCIRDIEPIGDIVTFDTPLKRFPDIYLVDETVSLGDRFNPTASYSGDFCVTHASPEQISFNLQCCGIDIRTTCIAHLYAPNKFGSFVHYAELYDKAKRKSNTLRPKQELGIPFMLRQALMEDGWICRSTIIWHKPNCMPESVKDRPTKSHEYLFLLSKSEQYYYNSEAIKEPNTGNMPWGMKRKAVHGPEDMKHGGMWSTRGNLDAAGSDPSRWSQGGRNKRSVWSIPTMPYPGSHFAVMPQKLVEPCILAGSSPCACEHCLAPWERVTEATGERRTSHWAHGTDRKTEIAKGKHGKTSTLVTGYQNVYCTVGWQPTCTCRDNTGSGKCIILDCFMGAGTTALVALQHGRNYTGIEINPDYVKLIEKRIAHVQQNLWTTQSEAVG